MNPSDSLYGWGFPPNISTHGAAIDQLINVVHWFMLVLFVGWGIYFIYCLFRFRSRDGHPASYESTKNRLPKYVEVGVIIVEAVLLIGLSLPVWSKLKSDFPDAKAATTVRVVAQQFVWNIHYPGRDGVFGPTDPKLITLDNPVGVNRTDPAGKDDLVSVGVMHFPVDKPVIARLSSLDVIHSFAIPVMRVKQDTIPGMEIPIWFQATETGQFEIACAQLCGVGHTRMRGFLNVDTAEQYETWLTEMEQMQGITSPEGT